MASKLFYCLNYTWRIVVTGSLFFGFGVGALLLVYCVIPFVGKQKVQQVISSSFRFFVFIAQTLGVISVKFKYFEKLQHDKGCLIISNHPTLLDYVLIISQLKQCNTIVKDELWNNFFLRKIICLANYIPNNKFIDIVPLIRASLEAKNNILIFPEGTRTVSGQPVKLKRGTAQIALRLGVPIRIVKITCKPHTLAKENSWYNIPEQRPLFTLEAMELVDPKEFLRDSIEFSIAARHLTKYLQTRLADKI